MSDTARRQMERQYQCALSHIGSYEPMLRYAIHHHRNLTGAPMSFREMPFLVYLYQRMAVASELVVMKCTAVGFTEAALVFAAYTAGERGRRHTFVYPDEDIVGLLVQQRVQPLVDRIPLYREMADAPRPGKDVDNLKLRHFGAGSWRFLGSNNPAKFREFQTDSILVDEYDDCKQQHLQLLRDRVRTSPAPQMFYFGNPKSTSGIARRYEQSDQGHWYQRCTRCRTRQRIDWFENVVEQLDSGAWVARDRDRAKDLTAAVPDPPRHMDIRPVCSRCGMPWERTDEGATWVIEEPGAGVEGLHVAQMDHLGRRLWRLVCEWIAAQDDLSRLTIFYGSVLGIGYEPKDSRLSVEDLQRCEREHSMDRIGGDAYRNETVVCGVDVGAVLNVVLDVIERRPDPQDPTKMRAQRVNRLTCACRTFEEVGDILQRYHVIIAVVDAEPEHHKAQEFRDWARLHTRTIVWLCRYHPTERVGRLPYGMVMDAPASTVQVDKTAVMDATTAEIRGGRRHFPQDIRHVLHWSEHMRTPVRKPRPAGKGKGDGYFWDRGNKRDDYRQAECYARIAWDLLGMMGSVTVHQR